MDDASYLVTGAFGLVGRALLPQLVDQGRKVVALDIAPKPDVIPDVADDVTIVRGDVTEIADLLRVVKTENITHIAHLAAIHLLRLCRAHPRLAYQVNVTGTINVLETARIMNLQRVIGIGSIGEFGPDVKSPIKEDDPKHPTSLYGITKLTGELFGLNYAANYGVDFISLRFPDIYGYGSISSWDPPKDIVENCLQGKAVILYGPPSKKRDTIYSKDAAKAIRIALKAEKLTHRTFHISSGAFVSLRDIATIAKKLIPNASIKIKTVPMHFQNLNGARAREELGFEPTYTFETGFKDYLNIRHTQMDEIT